MFTFTFHLSLTLQLACPEPNRCLIPRFQGIMSIDAGFDMVPQLNKGAVDTHNWENFIRLLKRSYENDSQVDIMPNYLLFKAGEHPKLPFEGHKFLRFSSKISGKNATDTRIEDYIDKVTLLATCSFGSPVRPWNEADGLEGHYDWTDVNESIRSYERVRDHILLLLSLFVEPY